MLPLDFKACMNAGIATKLLQCVIEELNVRLRAQKGPYPQEKIMSILSEDPQKGFKDVMVCISNSTYMYL